MRPLYRPLTATLAATLAAAAAATLVAAPAQAKPAITLTPGGLDRGADVAGPHLDGDGHTIVDGSVRVKVSGAQVRLLGKSGATYVAGTTNERGGNGRVYRVAADGSKTLIAKAHPFMSVLSADGATLVTTKVGRTSRSLVSVYDVATATLEVEGNFRDYAIALDVQGDRVLLGTTKKTLLWDSQAHDVATVSRDPGYNGDLAADVMATFTKDPYDGGCTEVRRIVSGELLWRSCTEQVAAFNADASRIATVGILSDGPGPGRVDARTISGQHLGRYQVRSGWFGEIRWETPTALLLDVNGARKAFTARCTANACERASSLHPAQTLRAQS